MKTNPKNKLISIKLVHTAIWIFFNVVIFYMLYAVLTNKIDKWLWIAYALIGLEAITLAIFKLYCPLTILARQYSDSNKDNFDIFLPNWLAKYTKLIYTTLVILISIVLIYRLS